MTKRTAIHWFRRDLRLHDNASLRAALDEADTVIPVFLYDRPIGAASRWWLHHSLVSLRAALRRSGSDLVVMPTGDALSALRELAARTGATAVHWNRLYEPALVERDSRIKRALQEDGIAATSHAGHLLHEPAAVVSKAGKAFRVLTPFWKALLQQLDVPPPLSKPRNFKPSRHWPVSDDIASLGLLPAHVWVNGLQAAWTPGETAALTNLRQFVKHRLKRYAHDRDFPSQDAVSRLSPHLHFGEISARQAWHAAGEPGVSATARDAFLRELGWREFTHHVLFHFPFTVTEPMYEQYRGFPWRSNHAPLLAAWQQGKTGYPIVDAGMRQLWRTGWMHNRVRMIAASMLVKNLRVPWQKGAAWFMDTLVDADLANNTFNWQWTAGCGADAAPYFRIFNPVLQSEKFEAAEYIREFLPELRVLPDKWIHKPWETPPGVQQQTGFVPGRDYPLPVVDYRESREEALAALRELKSR